MIVNEKERDRDKDLKKGLRKDLGSNNRQIILIFIFGL
jgi:hypothetical protein